MRNPNQMPLLGERTPRLVLLFGLMVLVGGSMSCEPYDQDPDEFAIDLNYSQEEMFGFSIEAYLQSNAPHLLPYAEMIAHVAGKERISPRVLIALMEQNSGAVVNPDFDESQPFADLSEKTGFLEQLRDVGLRLRGIGDTTDLRVVVAAPPDAVLKVLSYNEVQRLSDVYQQLFPGVVSQPKPVPRATAQVALQFPYPIGESWYFGGTHSDSGGDSPMSSIDFMKNGESWGDAITSKVVAAAPGKVKKYSSCYVQIIHSNGWSTGYYHMSNIEVQDGQTVSANQPIGKYANNKSQALCDGGSSTDPHVHWTLYYSNKEVNLSGKVLSGYSVHPGSFGYDDNCSRMYYTKNGKKTCPWTHVRNDGATDGDSTSDACPSDPNKTQPGICGCGVADTDTDKDGTPDCKEGASTTGHASNNLVPNGQLTSSQYLQSSNSQYRLYLQGDGNVVLRRMSDKKPLWATGTNGKFATRLIFQGDGNLVLRTASGAAVWSSKTAGRGGTLLQLNDDGSLAIYTGTSVVWSVN